MKECADGFEPTAAGSRFLFPAGTDWQARGRSLSPMGMYPLRVAFRNREAAIVVKIAALITKSRLSLIGSPLRRARSQTT